MTFGHIIHAPCPVEGASFISFRDFAEASRPPHGSIRPLDTKLRLKAASVLDHLTQGVAPGGRIVRV